MLEPRKEDSLPHRRFQQEVLFLVGEVEGLLDHVYGRRGLFEEHLDGRVGNHREPVRRLEKVAHILGNSSKPQVVLSAALGEREEEGRRILRLHHPPRLVHHQHALFKCSAHHIPDVVHDDVHGDWLELILHVADGENDKLLVNVHVGRLIEKARPGALRVLIEALGQRLASLHPREHQIKVRKQRGGLARKVGVGGDVFERVSLGNSRVNNGVLLRRETAEHDAKKPHEVDNVGAQDIGRSLVLAGEGQVKGINVVLGSQRNVEVAPARRFRHVLILAFGVNHNDINIKHETAQDFQLGGIGLACPRLGKGDRVVIFHREAVKHHQRGVVAVDAIENAAIAGKVKGGEGEERGER